ncbi:hypothetical protein C2G38_1951611, partial [Gigaspora rosea]
ECTEEYTFKMCGNCGWVDRNLGEKKFRCVSYRTNMDRDFNGTRNILLKSQLNPYRTRLFAY